jgi:hypothetical protein
MAFRIQTSVNEKTVTFSVSGRLGAEGIAELKRLLEGYPEGHRFVVDLKDVGLVERIGIRSLTAFEGAGVRLVNCPPYVRDWILGSA